jgi:predicted nucleic acid-binding protein
MATIDASLYVALINDHELHHARSWAWFETARTKQEPMAAPAILLAEVASALGRGPGETEARQAIRDLERSSIIELVPVTRALARRAAELAAEHRLRGCDAIYVALAERRGDQLVTLDRQQVERGAKVVVTRQP